MKQEKSVLPIILLFVVVVAGGAFVISRVMKRQREKLQGSLGEGGADNQNTTTTTTTTTTPTQSGFNFGSLGSYSFTQFPIKWGSKGDDVKALQSLLMQYDKNILNPFGADGKFGSTTERALKTVLGKTKVESQADIDTIKSNIAKKAQNIIKQVGINIGLGIPVSKWK